MAALEVLMMMMMSETFGLFFFLFVWRFAFMPFRFVFVSFSVRRGAVLVTAVGGLIDGGLRCRVLNGGRREGRKEGRKG